MAALLSLILLGIFLYYLIKVGIRVYGMYRKVHDAANFFRDINGQNGRYNNTYGSGTDNRSGGRTGSTRASHTTSTGDVIEDRRTEDEINRKIFTQEEGEYVDYEEVK